MDAPDHDLRDLLRTLSPAAREHLRNVLIRDHADRDAIAKELMRYRDRTGDDWADIIDMLTMHPEERQKALRLLGEMARRLLRLQGEVDVFSRLVARAGEQRRARELALANILRPLVPERFGLGSGLTLDQGHRVRLRLLRRRTGDHANRAFRRGPPRNR